MHSARKSETQLRDTPGASPPAGLPGGSDGKEAACSAGGLGSALGGNDPLEEGKAIHSSILAWRFPWTV